MLSFELTDDHRLLERSVREWAAREVAPRIHDLDRAHHCKGVVIYEGTRKIHQGHAGRLPAGIPLGPAGAL